MAREFGGVGAAPNRCEIEADVVELERSEQFADKWMLEIRILSSTSLEGPRFAREGTTARAFTFDVVPGLAAGARIAAQAEFLGDARAGVFQLTGIQILGT